MGRYYYGNITGKFWFATQDSNDAVNFGGMDGGDIMCYAGCGCHLKCGSGHFCEDCYDDYDQHINSAIEDGHIEEEDKDKPDILIQECGFFEMSFDGDQLEEVQRHIAEYEKIVLPLVVSFKMDEADGYSYDLELQPEYYSTENRDTDALIARWCLAKQVEQCLIDKGECVFDCEC